VPLDRKPECATVHKALEQILSAIKQHQFKAIRSCVTAWGPKEADSISDLYIKFPEAFSKHFMQDLWLALAQVTLLILWFSPVSILPHMLYIQIMHVGFLHRQWNCRNLNEILLCQWQYHDCSMWVYMIKVHGSLRVSGHGGRITG
jgi:hypothetical protein